MCFSYLIYKLLVIIITSLRIKKGDWDITKSLQCKYEQLGWMLEYKLLITPLLISVQGFAFRRRTVSLQSTARSEYIWNLRSTYPWKNPNEVNSLSRISIHRSDLPLTEMLLFQSLLLLICLFLRFALLVNKLFIIRRIGMFIGISVQNMFI